ncbi:C40 family peptidase [Streptacidiphilus sp. PB12-B1b]|uniref:C40 family peptidase n=1 Tax=Streptacidiphilus sp. PB12-B1b TaxID=2705012 RepID=UPI001CDD0C60|nr:C40 family peptidase [Streptacidiphilus sp. PB12-B1b]
MAGQRYDGAVEQARALQRETAQLQQHIAAEQQDVDDLTQGMGALAAAQYRQGGGMDPVMQLMFSSDPEQYLERATTMDEADGALATTLHSIRAEEQQLDRDRALAAGQLARLEQVRQTVAGSKAEVQHRIGRAQALLATLSGAQRQQLAQAEDSAADTAAQAAAAVLPPGEGPADSRAAAALAAAQSVLGRPYVYGATGPGAFDCSGLMYWSWRHAGVVLPRTSQEQAFAGRRIPLSQARPGDLVIYFGDMHHVGMYAGNGMVIHAPYPGARVRYERATDMPIAEVVRV